MKNLLLAFLLTSLTGYSQLTKDTVSVADSLGTLMPLFDTGADSEADADQQDVSGLLQSSKDIFVQFSAFQFGAGRFRIRGYHSSHQDVMINGLTMNNPETGMSSWSSWGGLNDVTRFSEVRSGIAPGRYNFSGAGGYVNIDSRASSFKRSTRATLTAANRIYQARFILTHATGISPDGWAMAFSASSRLGEHVAVPGTYFRASSFYVSIDKRINRRHLTGITAFAAPAEQGRASSATAEVTALAGDPYYNNNWGYQNGKVRNSRVSRSMRPTVLLSHVYEPGDQQRLTASLAFSGGKESVTSVAGHDAPPFRPDYYRFLPSYYYLLKDSVNAGAMEERWSDPSARQLPWDALIALNQANLYSTANTQGQVRNTSETRARYILESQVQQQRHLTFNSVYNRRLGRWFISGGISSVLFINRRYKEIEDLLGATFWLDVDQFAEELGAEEFIMQNDIDRPNRKVRTGDRFGYDYSLRTTKTTGWCIAEYNAPRADLYIGATAGESATRRTGHVANGKFPSTSSGTGPTQQFLNTGIKGGFTWKLNGRKYLSTNAMWLERPPGASSAYISPQTRHDVFTGLSTEKLLSVDASFHVNAPGLKLRLTAYFTKFRDLSWTRSYWDDTYQTSVNLFMSRVSQVHEGFELGIEKTIRVSHVLQGAAGLGSCFYQDRPLLHGWKDNSGDLLYSERVVYISNFNVGGTPQCVAGIGYRYNARRYWFAGMNVNYFDRIYVEINPLRRTAEATGKYLESESRLATQISAQERLPSFFIVNALAGRSWRLKKKRMVNAMISIGNLLNRTNVRIHGFEQLRFDPAFPAMHPSKYSRLAPFGFMCNLSLTI
jgi:hypothetical protein